MRQITLRPLTIAIAALVLAVVICTSLSLCAMTWARLADDTEIDSNAVRQLLKLAQTYPTGDMPQDNLDSAIQGALMPYYLQKYQPACWKTLQDAVAKNGANFTIFATDPFRQYRDVDNTIVEIQFQDGRKISIIFYQRTMVGCSLKLPEAK